MATLAKGRSAAIVSGAPVVTAAFVRDRDNAVPIAAIVWQLQQAVGADALRMIDAQGMAMALLGDTIGGNLLLLGFAFQHGLVPVSAAAIEQAIRLNDVAVEFNLKAFAWGRHVAVNGAAVEVAVGAARGAAPARLKLSQSLDEVIGASRISPNTRTQRMPRATRRWWRGCATRSGACCPAIQRSPKRWRAISTGSVPTRTSTRLPGC
jgi:indolepyruvate ferredoxin oxidoreductase